MGNFGFICKMDFDFIGVLLGGGFGVGFRFDCGAIGFSVIGILGGTANLNRLFKKKGAPHGPV